MRHWARLDRRFRRYREDVSKSKERARLESIPRYEATTTNLLGSEIHVPDAASFLSAYEQIFAKRVYDFPSETDRPVIMDCGANIGLATLFWKARFPEAEITAFEPDPSICEILLKNLASAGIDDVDVVCAAVWSEEAVLDFVSEGADAGKVVKQNTNGTRKVRAVRLREYLSDAVDLIKLDVEGAETRILLDCWDKLDRVERIFVEYHSFEDSIQDLDELLAVLRKSGFRIHVHPEWGSPKPFFEVRVDASMDHRLNIFAFRRSSDSKV